MDNKRYQVFVSSTYLDLQDERHEVMQALLELDAIPAGMELFPASNDEQWKLIQRVIDQCDYYIVIVGTKYGTLIKNGGISYTEQEYDYAVERGIPVLGFLHAEPGDIADSKSEQDPDKREQLAEFREKVYRMEFIGVSRGDPFGKSLVRRRGRTDSGSGRVVIARSISYRERRSRTLRR